MRTKENMKRMVTPVGIAYWPYIGVQVEKYQGKEVGYSIQLKLSDTDTEKLKKDILKVLEMTPIEFYETLKDSSERYSYSIFIDEEPTVEVAFKDSPLSNLPSLDSSDIDTMRHKNIISVDEKSNRITWTAEEPLKGIYRHYRDFFKGYVVYLSKEAYQHNLDNPFIIHIRPEMWSLFESVTVLSYRVKYSIFRAYCNLYQLPLDYYHVSRDSDTFVEGYVEKKPKGCKRLCICKDYLETFRNEEVNIKGLSYSWYNKTNTKGIKTLRSYMDKCIRNKPFGTILWTTYKPKKEALKIPKHGLNDKNWIACNTKATNDYKDRTAVIYGINRYMSPFKASFWQSQGIPIDMDNWSLNELIQFLWRSNLRDTYSSDTVYVYIPSDRMRGLLEEWLLNDQVKNFGGGLRPAKRYFMYYKDKETKSLNTLQFSLFFGGNKKLKSPHK